MATLTTTRTLNTDRVANRIKQWFDTRNFETTLLATNGSHYVKARKSSWWRTAIAADRALQVGVHNHEGGGTYVEIKQGDWTTNIVSNAAWFMVTGGTNLLISGWSFVLQKEVENYIQYVLNTT